MEDNNIKLEKPLIISACDMGVILMKKISKPYFLKRNRYFSMGM